MQVINDGALRILIPEKGYKLVNKFTGITSHKIYLCTIDTPDNYTETVDEDYVPMNYVVDLANLKTSTEETIDIILEAMNELYNSFEPLLAMVPATMEEIEAPLASPLAKLYYLMLQRELIKNIEEVPEKFRSDVIKLMNN